MSKWNIAAKSQEERDKVNVDLAASGVAYKERLNQSVIAEQVAREQRNTCASTLWSACAITANKAFNSREHPIRAISKWLNRTLRSR